MTTLWLEKETHRKWHMDGTAMLKIVLCFSIVVPSRYVFPPLGGVGRPDILIGVGLFIWWVVAHVVPSLTPRVSNPLRIVLLYWFVVTLASLVVAYGRPMSVLEESGTERALIGVLSNIGIVLICAEAISTRERLEQLLKFVTYLGGFLASVGSLQFFAGIDISPYLVPPGLGLNNDLYGVGTRSIFNRVSGTSIHAIEYGAVLALILPLACHFAVHSKTRAESHLRWALAGLIFLGGLYSLSRTNTIAVGMVMTLMVALWTGRMRLNAMVAGVVALVVVHGAIPGLLGTIKSLFQNLDNDPSIQGRTNDYPIAFEYVSERPFLGRGPGTWNVEEYFVLDNNWLGTLLQTGWLGVAAKAFLLMVPFVLARHVLNSGRDNEWRHLGGILSAQLAVVFTVGFFFDSNGFPQFHALEMVLIGAVGALWIIDRRGDPHDFRPGVRGDLLKPTKSRSGDRHPLERPKVMVLPVPSGPVDES